MTLPEKSTFLISPEQFSDDYFWKETFRRKLDSFEVHLASNTEATVRIESSTQELVELLNSWRGAMKVMNFIGKLAKPITATTALGASLVALWFSIWPRK